MSHIPERASPQPIGLAQQIGDSDGVSPRPPLRVCFCAWPVAGWRTQYENVRSAVATVADVSVRFVEIDPYRAGGIIERLPLLGRRTKGSLRSVMNTAPVFRARPIDVVWTQADTPMFPVLATRVRFADIPYVISTDSTMRQLGSFREYDIGSPGGRMSLKHRIRDRLIDYCLTYAAGILATSQWAADAIVAEHGVPSERVTVNYPGVDLTSWPSRDATGETGSHLPRLLFVGGEFARKGGPALLDVFRAHLRGRCELHLVTREFPTDSRGPEEGVFVYADLTPNDGRLRRLYATADALVLPTRADCFSLAAIEAMASGLPVIISAVGGIPEIVEHGASGWLVPVGDPAALRGAIEAALADPDRARAMGRRGRAIVEAHFDARANAVQAFALLRAIHEAHQSRRANRDRRTARI